MRTDTDDAAVRASLVRAFAASVLFLLLVGCGDRNNPPSRIPDGDAGPDGQTVRGTERLRWNQQAPDTGTLARYRYAAYIDDVRVPLVGVACSPQRDRAGYSCSAPLPRLSPGRHVIELVTTAVEEQATLESARSAPTVVIMAGSLSSGASPGENVRTFRSEGRAYRVDVVARNLTMPAALALTPDRRLLVAEQAGTVRIFEPNHGSEQIALSRDDLREDGDVFVHGLTLDPLFVENGFVFLLYTTVHESSAAMRLVRLRELDNALGEPAVLVDDVPSSGSRPPGAVAFGRDGKLYVATSGMDEPESRDAFSGKVLRFNADGTVPDDAVLGSPVFAAGAREPVAIESNPFSDRMWLVARSISAATVDTVARREAVEILLRRRANGAQLYRGSLLDGFRNDLFVAGDDQRLERLTFDPARRTWRTKESLLAGWFGRLQAITEGLDGALYVGSGNSVASGLAGQDVVVRIVPEPSH